MSAGPVRNVLVIDDDPIIVKGYGQRLRNDGWEVATGADGYEAMVLIGQKRWDLILLDLRLPYRSGVEILRAIRARPESAGTVVCMLAAPGDDEYAQAAHEAGCSAVFEKLRVPPREVITQATELVDRAANAPRRPPPRQGAASPEAAVPDAVQEIARRLRRGGSESPAHAPAARPVAVSVAAPVAAPAADLVVPRPRRVAPRIATPAPVPEEPPRRFDVMLQRMVGQAGPLAGALGLPEDFSCPDCSCPLMLRVEPDPAEKRAVRGRFYCPRCRR